MFSRLRLAVGPNRFVSFRFPGYTKVGCVEIVFSSDPDQREQCIAASIGERRPHALWRGSIADAAIPRIPILSTNVPARCWADEPGVPCRLRWFGRSQWHDGKALARDIKAGQ